MFTEKRETPQFNWDMIGDIDMGRPNLGGAVSLAVYRLMQFTLRDVLITEYDPATADRIFYRAGKLAGREFCRNLLDKTREFNDFIRETQTKLKDLKVGVLRVEAADLVEMRFTLTVAEDVDCSGLPDHDETVCTYDEGFLDGLLSEYTGNAFTVKEVDCWASGDRVCRFEAKPAGRE